LLRVKPSKDLESISWERTGVLTPTFLQQGESAGCQWLTPVILATQDAEIKRIMVQS
jgi:hypothetical protein